MVSGAQGAQRRRGVGAAARPVERRRRRQQRMRVRAAEKRGRRGRVIAAAGQARVTTQMLQQLLRRGESLAAVRLPGDPVADVGPAAGQRGRIGQRRGRHRAQRRQRHGQAVLLMVALGATAGTAARAHHDLGAVHAVLATGAIGILADRDQGFAAGRSLDAGVSQVRVAAGRTGRRVAEQRCRGGVMMREGRRAREGRPEGWILGKAGRTAQRIARVSRKSWLVGRQVRVLCMRAGKDLHSRSDDRAGAVVIVVVVVVVVVIAAAVDTPR